MRQTENSARVGPLGDKSFLKKAAPTPFFQPKLTVNTPGDAYEQEADAVADQVMRMQEGDAPIVQRMPLTSVGDVQRKCAACEQEEQQAQRKESGGGDASGKAAPGIVSAVLSSGSGRPIEGGTRQFMESRFGQDFGQVRVHTDSRAAESASAIQAHAYTSGRNIVFGAGQYQPESESGKRLLAHELAHVGQQGGGSPQIQRSSWFQTDCYRYNSGGSYQSKWWFEPKAGWTHVHDGPCERCEGASILECCEPPDRNGVDCVESSNQEEGSN